MSRSVKVARLPKCDFEHRGGCFNAARYDGKTKQGSWANMCEQHFEIYGVGLGTGRGQKLLLDKEALS